MRTVCPECGTSYPILADHVGRRVKCSRDGCGHSFIADEYNDPPVDSKQTVEEIGPTLKRRNWKEAYAESLPGLIATDNRDRDDRRRRIPIVTTDHFRRGEVVDSDTLGAVCSRRLMRTGIMTLGIDTALGKLSFSLDTGSLSLYQQMEAELFDDLRLQADQMGAAAIVGLRISFGEIEWGNAVFLTGFAQGTAARLTGRLPYE